MDILQAGRLLLQKRICSLNLRAHTCLLFIVNVSLPLVCLTVVLEGETLTVATWDSG